jgi:pimeloyl-ACP methyl ester carboxylesterase
VAYVDWGPADAGVPVLCVHGLTRQGRDFDYLAAELAGTGRRVICPEAPFGELADEHWMQITRHSVAWDASRERYFMLCDPQIVRAFRNPWHYSLDLWKYWTAIKTPSLVLRGVGSDLLPPDLARDMIRRNSWARVLEIEGCGHAPPLMSHEQIERVCEFLQA